MIRKEPDTMWGWFIHGISKNGKWTSDKKEFYTECLWCGVSDKLYINPHKGTGVYQCKVCSQQGNYLTFLKEVNKLNKHFIKEYELKALAEDRNLPVDAFEGYGIGWNGTYFTLPIRDVENELVGLKLYKPGQKLLNSPGTKAGLFCAARLKEHMNGPIIICEGEWDTVAMTWLMRELKEPGTVVGVPGANNNVKDWEMYFYDKDVITLYDNDPAGIEGEFKVYQQLQTKAKTLSFIHWPETKADGYDVRDLISRWAFKENYPEKALKLIKKWLHQVPRKLSNYATPNKSGKLTLHRKEKLEPVTFEEVVKCYQDYLYLPNIDPIKITLATVFANRFRSEMVWMFLVAPPSSGKSELITSLFGTPEIESVSKLTEHTLISGFVLAGGGDASLIDKLRNRVLAIKDFTPIMGLPPPKQEEIFGVLRDAYDTQVDFMYGHGQHKRFKNLHFGVIAGVTGAIEAFGRMQQQLGERFLRYYIPISKDRKEEEKKAIRAMGNIGHEEEKKRTLKDMVHRFLQTHQGGTPILTDKIRVQLRAIANFTAAMRGIVPRDFKGHLQYHPSVEGSSRITKQLTVLALGLACLEKKKEVDEKDVKLVKQVAISTCPDLVRTAVRTLYHAKGHMMTIKEMEEKTKFPVATIKFLMEDLAMLGMIHKAGTTFKSLYKLSDYTEDLIVAGHLYSV